MIDFFKDHLDDILAIIGAAVTLATLIVKLTPSQKDDGILEKVVGFLDYLSVVNKKPSK